MNINQRIAQELAVQEAQVAAAVGLLDEGATVPFIARYRKEATGGLDDTQLRNLEERLHTLRELEERRAVVLNSIREQGKLTPELETALLAAETRTALEDLYLPYKPRRRTKAQIAREAGLEPLAHALLNDPTRVPETVAAGYVDADKGVADVAAALDGARQILMEEFAETAELVGQFGSSLQPHGDLLICAHTDMLDVLGDGVGRLRAEIGDKGDDDDNGGHQEPSTDTAATSAGYSSRKHTFPLLIARIYAASRSGCRTI